MRGIIEIAGYILEQVTSETTLVKYLFKGDCNGKYGKLPNSIQSAVGKV